MLPKTYRLSLKNPKKRGPTKRYEGAFFNLVVGSRGSSTATTQFAFIVSTRVDKKAVIRNRVKRLLSEAVRPLLPRIRPGAEVLVFTKPTAAGKDLKEFQEEIGKVFSKIGLI